MAHFLTFVGICFFRVNEKNKQIARKRMKEELSTPFTPSGLGRYR